MDNPPSSYALITGDVTYTDVHVVLGYSSLSIDSNHYSYHANLHDFAWTQGHL